MKAVTFTNDNNAKLFGILHQPAEKRKDTGIILISSGIKSRVAPHRLYLKMARQFAEMGYPTLRVDPEGLGDAEGEIEEQWIADVYCSIEIGLLINDTIAAIDWMFEECGVEKVILAGLCGGAITALLTGNRDQRVSAVLSLGMPSVLASSKIDPTKYITTGQLQTMRDGYLKKALNLDSWKRFLRFQTDYSLLLKSFFLPMLKKPKAELENSRKKEASVPVLPEDTNLNPHFAKAFLKFTSQRKLLLIFSETDRLYWEFQEKFMHYYEELANRNGHNFEIHVVKEANHVFSFGEWQKEMMEISCKWLEDVAAPLVIENLNRTYHAEIL
ncbi:hypothetical protein [Desulfopila inferna]|uniref:hypothetical protein n=1 Tax=Desulfopila inferna TaxID=468528 RepID=UPI001965BFD7|nr:hypothetical protein [Desulfopila inferna]MBM9605721.1 hypothetical protein [Desulfopila inferna]